MSGDWHTLACIQINWECFSRDSSGSPMEEAGKGSKGMDHSCQGSGRESLAKALGYMISCPLKGKVDNLIVKNL